ncbi:MULTISPECIES: hypothetical protein [unclassified Pseudodesulfovibrio]|uniref:hypothetical protein n=1 Tax=unclassified Pseudodesulfovibrio TaxID=2661612 RepID=UPI000FEBE89E|nr:MULTISPECIES: hypothetical protein [unclassified Pseudodesulfovibrio]MCJ2164920.1 hypothetical protein [Pseudodesulfovibrio sp. S3-i]RWU03717.1 hypothetical protein DWB63_09655 [Pseudodesulfovibrio sp. S3]
MQQVSESVLEAFGKMWGLYPAPVMLIHASREVLAVNACADGLGIAAGIQCHSLYPRDKVCPGCQANKALKTGSAVRKTAMDNRSGRFLDGYWIPVQGESDIYVHFGSDITEYVKPELMTD